MTNTGTIRHELPERAGDPQAGPAAGRCGSRRVSSDERRSRTGGRAEPRRARLRLRRAPPRAPRRAPSRGTPMPGGRHARVAEERPLADARPVQPHPAALQLVGGDHRVVGEERAVVDRRHRRDEQHRRCLDVASDLGAEQAQPDGREQARVQREQDRARRVQQSLGRPGLPGDAAAHRMPPLAQPDREQPHERSRRARRTTTPATSVAGHEPGERAQRRPRRACSTPRMPAATTSAARGEGERSAAGREAERRGAVRP